MHTMVSYVLGVLLKGHLCISETNEDIYSVFWLQHTFTIGTLCTKLHQNRTTSSDLVINGLSRFVWPEKSLKRQEIWILGPEMFLGLF